MYGIPMVRMFLFRYSELYGRLIFQKVTLLKTKNSMSVINIRPVESGQSKKMFTFAMLVR